ncbi:HAMP domain-containing sensor histidine kinase, partial [Butyricicoccus sp.]|uniref:HAMP domain-containing sensor histidine kinase n=1 Tax=Butyricicoccus sp. TaxID=2049021 RepID=UPI003D7E9277
MNRSRLGLKGQALLAVVLCSLIACGFYLCINKIGEVALDQCLSDSAHVEKKNEQMLTELQEYIIEKNLAISDTNAIDTWMDDMHNAYLMLGIYQNDVLVYDSTAYRLGTGYFDKTYSDDMEDGFTAKKITFAGGTAQVLLYGYYDSALYTTAVIIEVGFAVLVFALLFISWFGKKIAYIRRLEQEIKILETGGLEKPITVRGTDELGTLANGLNQMRMALAENMEKEAEAKRANYELIAAVSHDLRTPMTSLSLYLDLLREGKYDNAEEMNQYLDKSREKIVQIKQLSDQLFDRFYMSKKSTVKLESPVKAQFILEDYLSNLAGFLEVNGYHIQAQLDWPETYISVSLEYISRILDNIGSNILKYADPSEPILLTISGSAKQLVIRFENKILLQGDNLESTQVGVR